MEYTQLTFGNLLTHGIEAIQKTASIKEKKKVSQVVKELAEAIGRKASTIEWYRKNHPPTTQIELERLAQEIFSRGKLSPDWLEQFLIKGGHRSWQEATNKIALSNSTVLDLEDTFCYKRNKLYISKQILPDGVSESFIQTEIEVLSAEPIVDLRNKVINLAIPISEFEVKLLQYHRADGGMVAIRTLAVHEPICQWAVQFDPPLKQGQKASYAYKTVRKSFSMTRLEIESQYQQGLRRGNYEFWSLKIETPIDELEVQIIFPMYFEITPPPEGWLNVYKGSHEQRKELKALLSQGCFSASRDSKLNRWMIRLKIAPVIPGHRYAVCWRPS